MVRHTTEVPKPVSVSAICRWKSSWVPPIATRLLQPSCGSPTSKEARLTRMLSRQARSKYMPPLTLYSSFREVSKLVFKQASTIKPDRIVLLFRHSVLHLFNYLTFTPLWMIHEQSNLGTMILVYRYLCASRCTNVRYLSYGLSFLP